VNAIVGAGLDIALVIDGMPQHIEDASQGGFSYRTKDRRTRWRGRCARSVHPWRPWRPFGPICCQGPSGPPGSEAPARSVPLQLPHRYPAYGSLETQHQPRPPDLNHSASCICHGLVPPLFNSAPHTGWAAFISSPVVLAPGMQVYHTAASASRPPTI